MNWKWDDPRFRLGVADPDGTGGNYGLESARFPSAWNVLDRVRLRDEKIDTLVIDDGFATGPTGHPDLAVDVLELCQEVIAGCPNNNPAAVHGTHVAGTIGAKYDNPAPRPRSVGVSGGNPVARLRGASTRGTVRNGIGYSTVSDFAVWNRALEEKKPGGRLADLRVVNYSATGVSFARGPDGRLLWGVLQAGRLCGPDANDDATGTMACTPNNEDTFLKDVADMGLIARAVAEKASARDALLAVATANDSNKICASPTTVAQPLPAGGCPSGMTFVRLDARRTHHFGWAARHWNHASANPILMVEAVDANHARAPFSNIGGDIAAAGVNVLSTIPVPGPAYGLSGGTSMATPHVSALAGYLLAYNPSLHVGQLRNIIIDSARHDVTDSVTPRLDAFAALLRVPGAAKDLADMNDPSADGNRRIIRSRGGGEHTDTTERLVVGDTPIHSDPDGHVDMRDFRRFRDAFLWKCGSNARGAGCPPVPTITLDGAADHPKKDLNQDGCVTGTDPACNQFEIEWSRFDLNGDGHLDPDLPAYVPLGPDGTAIQATDLDMLARFFEEPSEGWRRHDLPRLLLSGDLEVHADAMFASGATKVDVEVRYGDGRGFAPPAAIHTRGGSVIVTVPTDDAGTPVEIIGRAEVAGQQMESELEIATLKHGQDARIDLCVPVLDVSSARTGLYADGADATKVYATYRKCDGEPLESAIVHFSLYQEGSEPVDATLSAAEARTDQSGRATVDLKAGASPETVKVGAEITIPGHPGTPPQVIRATKELSITNPPRLLYRWEQVTTDWQYTRFNGLPNGWSGDTTEVDQGTAPVVIERAGSLTPVAVGPAGSPSVRFDETVGPSTIAFDYSVDFTCDDSSPPDCHDQSAVGSSSRMVPTVERHQTGVLGGWVVDAHEPDGRPRDPVVLARTSMDVTDDTVVAHGLGDLSAVRYAYDSFDNADCDTDFFCSVDERDQVALAEREEGSSVAFASDPRRDLLFQRGGDGTWTTYRWCGPERTFAFAPEDFNPELWSESGTATSRFRFVATITTDPDVDAADLELPTGCEDAKPPIAAIARDFVEAEEGQMVRFVDASSDPNNDVSSWAWDFGDGTTSTEQFPDHQFADDGGYRVTLTVTDDTGNTDSTFIDVTVVNGPPEVDAEDVLTKSREAAVVALRLFDPGERDQEALKVQLSWAEPTMPRYGEFTTHGGTVTARLGVLPDGRHPLTITVTDKEGATASKVITVTVGDVPQGTVEPEVDIETEPAPGCDYGVKLNIEEQDFVGLVSGYRVDNRRGRVYPSPRLTQAAEQHARWLRDNDRFDHEGEDDSTPADRAVAVGYAGSVSENLARGQRNAPEGLADWKYSDAHNLNQLDSRWRTVGIARVSTPRGWLWVVMYGDTLDCPDQPPDLEPPTGEPPDPIFPPVIDPVREVKPWLSSAEDSVVPVVAFTLSDATPTTGQGITVTNRSRGSVTLASGDGRPSFTMSEGTTNSAVYLDPGRFMITASQDDRRAVFALEVGGPGLPPVVTYTGPAGVAQGGRAELSATVTTAGGTPVGAREVTFTVGSVSGTAVTNEHGRVVSSTQIRLMPGDYYLSVSVTPLPNSAGATTTVPFTVTANAAPVAEINGPYDVLVGSPLEVDFTGTFDPDGLPVDVVWDLNGDGSFDDALGQGPVSAPTLDAELCRGTCAPDQDYPIAVRVIDVAGGEAEDTTVVRFRRDFSVSVTPGHATVNPGGNISFQVGVVTTSGYDQPVSLEVPDLPEGVTAAFSPRTLAPTGMSVLTLTAAPDAQSFDGPFAVRGRSGDLVHDATSTVNVEFGLIPACYGVVNVRVTDKETGLPVAGASVTSFTAAVLTTDADGRAQVTGVPLGPANEPWWWGVGAGREGYWHSDATNVLFGCGVESSLDVSLLRMQFGTVTGRVVVGVPDPNDHTLTRAVTPTDTPVAGATLSGSHVGFASYPSTAPSDADGRFALQPIPLYPGTNEPVPISVSAFKDGYWIIASEPVTVHADTAETVTVALVPKCTGAVDVRVLDATTRRPLPNVDVNTNGPRGRTGADGRVRISGILLGERNSAITTWASASSDGRVWGSGSFRLEDCGALGVVDIVLRVPVERVASAAGRVTDAETGAPIADASVSSSHFNPTRTDADGGYRIDRIRIGHDDTTSVEASVRAAATGYLPQGARVTLEDGLTTVTDFQLVRQKYGDVRVTVRDALTGDPLVGARVVGPYSSFGYTGGDGAYVLTDQAVGPNNEPITTGVTATMDGYWWGSATVTIRPDETVDVEVELLKRCATATITGRVVHAETGLPLAGSSVTPLPYWPYYVLTDDQGRFALDGFELNNNQPFSVRVAASKEGFLRAERDVLIYCGARVTVNFGAPESGSASLSGVVTEEASGSPITGALVGTEWGATTTTAADGSYSFATVPVDGGTEKTWRVDVLPPADRELATASQTVTVYPGDAARLDFALVAPTNRRPVADGQQLTVPAGSRSVEVTLSGSDPDGDPLTYRVMYPSGPQTLPGNTLTWSIAEGSSEERFLFVVSDGQRDSEAAEVVITVEPPGNEPPTAVISGPTAVREGDTVDLSAVAFPDPDRSIEGIGWDLDGDGQFDDATGQVASLTRTDDAAVTVGVQVTDDAGATGTASHTVTFANVAPTLDAGGSADVNVGDPLQRDGSFTDPGTDSWTATVNYGDGSDELPMALDGNRFALDHTYSVAGTYEASVTVCDDDGGCGRTLVIVSVRDVPPPNRGPLAVDDAFATALDTPVSGNVFTNDRDPDGDLLIASVMTAPEHGTLDLHSDGSFTYTPAAGFAGTDTFSYQAADPDGATATAEVGVTVDQPNQPPVSHDDAFETPEDTPVNGSVLGNDTDPDGDPLTASMVNGPEHGQVDLQADGTFTYTPAADFHGTDTFRYEATDGKANTPATVTVRINPTNDPPIANPDMVTTREGRPVTGNVLSNDADPDGDPVTATLVTGPSGGELDLLADGSFTYTPKPHVGAAAAAPTETFTYTADDGTAESAAATVTITITPNGLPVAVDDETTTAWETAVTVDVLSNDGDPDGDALTVTVRTPPEHGTVSCEGSTCIYTPSAGYSGPDSFRYRIDDGLTTAEAKVTITIAPQTTSSSSTSTTSTASTTTTEATGADATTDQKPDGRLPRTGTDIGMPAVAGGILVTVGILLIVTSRRRRRWSTRSSLG